MKNSVVEEIIKKIKECDDFHNRCDYLLEHDECTYLIEYIKELEEENKEFHILMKMRNEREYSSKFLKDFQKEHGKNVFPDYDEIYKRYDIFKKENEKLNNIINELEEWLEYKINIFSNATDNENLAIAGAFDAILDKLKELKENK